MLNVQADFDDDKLLPGMSYEEQCTFYLKLIENEPLFGAGEEENCNSEWPITGDSFGRDFYDVTNSMKLFVIPLPLLSDDNQNFGIKIKLDPAENIWVAIGQDCKYSKAYRKANREIMAIYRLEDDEGNFQPPKERRKMNICLRLQYSDNENKVNTLNITGYEFLPEEPSYEEPQDDSSSSSDDKSFRPRPTPGEPSSGEPIDEAEANNIKDLYEGVKNDLMIEDAIKINSNYQISDWGSLKNNDEQTFSFYGGDPNFGEDDSGLSKMTKWSLVGGFVAFSLLIIIAGVIFVVHRKKSQKSYAAGKTNQ